MAEWIERGPSHTSIQRSGTFVERTANSPQRTRSEDSATPQTNVDDLPLAVPLESERPRRRAIQIVREAIVSLASAGVLIGLCYLSLWIATNGAI